MGRILTICSLLLALSGCSFRPIQSFHALLEIEENFGIDFVIEFDDQTQTYEIVNGEERIEVHHSKKGDSVVLEHPVFNSKLVFVNHGEKLEGFWYNEERGNYKMPLKATLISNTSDKADVSGKYDGMWEVSFASGEPAIALFNKNKEGYSGTFLTETGDYRYLHGTGNSFGLQLSTFDFAHAYLFMASLTSDSLKGSFYSGHSYHATWTGTRNEQAKLNDPGSFVAIDSSVTANFTFTGLSGETITIDHPLFKNKPIILELFGSWCPNCYDEAKYLNELVEDKHLGDAVLIGAAFERTETMSESIQKIEKYRNGLSISFPLVYGGYANKDTATSRFNNISKIVAFPTLLFYNREHELVAVHTGFSGPGTGKYYLESKNQILMNIEAILE